jgi:hypothetical protein
MFVKATGFRVRRAALCGGAYGGRAVSSAESIGYPMRRTPEGRCRKNRTRIGAIVNRCRTQCVGEIRWLHMTKVREDNLNVSRLRRIGLRPCVSRSSQPLSRCHGRLHDSWVG